MTDAAVPTLPTYGAPTPRKCAILPTAEVSGVVAIPDAVREPKPPGIMTKMISKMLPKKLGKMKAPRMKASIPKVKNKTQKRRHIVHVK